MTSDSPNSRHSLLVFLCHASEDKPAVRDLYERLKNEAGINPWLDEEELLPWQDWNLEIEKALKKSDAIIICVSSTSVKKEGYVQREIKRALRKAEETLSGSIFVIPVKLNQCELPYELQHLQSVKLYEANGYDRLVKSLRLRAKSLEP